MNEANSYEKLIQSVGMPSDEKRFYPQTELMEKLHVTSSPGIFAGSQPIERPWDDHDPDPNKWKYFGIELWYQGNWTAYEKNWLNNVFLKCVTVMTTNGPDNLWGETASAFHKVITSPTRTLSPTARVVQWCSLAAYEFGTALTDAQFLFPMFPGLMTNYRPGVRPDYCPARRQYFPIYLERFEEPQRPDRSWRVGYATIGRLTETKDIQIFVNATAVNNAGITLGKWASLMFHEMLHNIGWEHDNYTDRQQFMLQAEDAFYRFGGD